MYSYFSTTSYPTVAPAWKATKTHVNWSASVRAAAVLALALSLGCAGCSGDSDETVPAPPTEQRTYPSMLVAADRKDEILSRLLREPYQTIYATIQERAAKSYEEPDPDIWDHSTIGHNNTTAQANAFIGWLQDDEAAANKARDFLLRMPTDFETNQTWDVNIRMPHVLMTYAYGWDLLKATPWFSDADAADAAERVTTVTDKFFDKYLENSALRQLVLGESQNNHPIRTASAIGLVGLTFGDHPQASTWTNWAISELSYLFSVEGCYVQSDGGISEGPFYYGFAFGPAIATFITMDVAIDPQRQFARDCRNRQAKDPWNVDDCVDGELFTFDNPLHTELFHHTVDWSINLRLPSGWRAILGDAYLSVPNGGALLTGFDGGGHTRWDWEQTKLDSWPMTWGMDLTAHHLIYFDDSVAATEPSWRNRFLPAAGNAVFRSGWDEDARWLLLLGEEGSARKTLHDHVDGTSFSLAAYGDYLLIDPGYYKPVETDNAITAHSDSHNTIRIAGHGAPDKGLLTDFGDVDASLHHSVDGTELAYAEAHQSYVQTDIERSVVFVRQRYFLVADRLSSQQTSTREHAWRLGGWAGYDTGGTFEVFPCLTPDSCGARWERDNGGVYVHLAATEAGLTVVEPPYEPLTAPHVGEFDRHRTIEDHGVIDGVLEAVAPGYLAVLAPYRVGAAVGAADASLTVTALDAGSGAAAWQVESSLGCDVAWLRTAGAATALTLPSGAVLNTDAELTVVDTAGSFGLIARGTSADLDGTVVVAGDGASSVVKAEP